MTQLRIGYEHVDVVAIDSTPQLKVMDRGHNAFGQHGHELESHFVSPAVDMTVGNSAPFVVGKGLEGRVFKIGIKNETKKC